jgi:hypothetical protein
MNQQQQIKPDVLRRANNLQPRMPNMMNMQQIRPQQPMQLRPTYICTICKKPGHPKSLCSEAGTLPKPEERSKFPYGIPKNKIRVARLDDNVEIERKYFRSIIGFFISSIFFLHYSRS